MRYIFYSFLAVFLIINLSCDKGIAPEPEPETPQEGFGGKIIFYGQWREEVTRTHLIVFKEPLKSPADFSLANLAYVSLSIPKGSTEYSFSTLDSCFYPANSKLGSGKYSFTAVAQQTTPVMTMNGADWQIVGVYFEAGNDTIPGVITVPPGKFIENITIYCKFNSSSP